MTKLIPAEVALSIPMEMRQATKWPPRGDHCRLEPVALPVLFPKFLISKSDRVFTIGSCFARNIEEYLGVLGFDVPTLKFTAPAGEVVGRPSGILNKYTPASMLQEIERTIRLDTAPERDRHKILSECLIDGGDGSVLDLELSSLTYVSAERALERRQQVHRLFRELYECDLVILTLGLVESWWDDQTKLYIQRAPMPPLVKRYPGRFFFKRMDFEETAACSRQIVAKLNGMGRKKRVLVTTSPVPMGRTFAKEDVLVANTYSKSLLRVVSQILKDENENVDYYPSFETVVMSKSTDVWENDLIHVTDRFVGRVVNRMIEAYYPDFSNIDPASQAWSEIFARDFKSALATIKQVATPDATLKLLHGLALIGRGDREDGRRMLRDNCLHATLDNRQAGHVAAALHSAADLEPCLQFLRAFLARVQFDDHSTAAMHARMALILAEQGDRAGALLEGRVAIQAREAPAVLVMVGEACYRLGEDDLARDHLQKALAKLSMAPAHAAVRGNAYACLALVECRAGNTAAALGGLQRAKLDAPKAKLTLAAEAAMRPAK